MLTAAAIGAGLGLSAGLAPGPLSTLVIRQTLRYGVRDGVKIALVPLLTDVPIIVVTLFVLDTFADLRILLLVLSTVGGFYVFFLAYQTWRVSPPDPGGVATHDDAITIGVVANLLNPHPYIFWATVGGPYIVTEAAGGGAAAWGFLAGFYTMLIGSKMLMAVTLGRYRNYFTGRLYRSVMRMLAVLLVAFGVFLLSDAALLVPALRLT
jgi:threonine/homoserine/homoserine lactone efflux protein